MTTQIEASLREAVEEVIADGGRGRIRLDSAWLEKAQAALIAAAEVGTEAEENHRMGFVSGTAADGDKWDRWYGSLPCDLRRKLSLHDFKRLGDLFDNVGQPEDWIKKRANIRATAIERCAQWLIENYGNSMRSVAHDMRRALKDKP
jgi:hypothetical protein